NTVKYAVAGACALAASSTAVLAQEIPAGFTAGIDLASPLPTGFYAIDINVADGFDHSAAGSFHGNLYATVPGVIWSSPYEIAGGKLGMTSLFAYGDYENDGWNHGLTAHTAYAGPWASIVEANIKWNFGSLSVSENAGIMYLFGSGNFITARLNNFEDNTNFVGSTDFAWKVAPSVEALLNVKYGNANLLGTDNNGWLTLEGALLKKFGKMETGALLVYSSNLSGAQYDQTYVGTKIGYAFDGFTADIRFLQSVEYSGTAAATGNDTKVFVDFIKPLYVAQDEPLK
ncbi:MAG: hypothetical protein WCC96_11740, partial [Rhodomicrobium sp.]